MSSPKHQHSPGLICSGPPSPGRTVVSNRTRQASRPSSQPPILCSAPGRMQPAKQSGGQHASHTLIEVEAPHENKTNKLPGLLPDAASKITTSYAPTMAPYPNSTNAALPNRNHCNAGKQILRRGGI
ncbi:hypothetical protein BT67DRAFT_1485 [Trichocladium antarcticum]|uniref:Uncharacterized protein n=1 Tax=Trichocladium antarcticum TaxID=1450529 RepID=A0AAN6ZHY9_9PEZI|nr:hypothetical protein BT67DRAFT_1485 [Trichocladium antarcticum]